MKKIISVILVAMMTFVTVSAEAAKTPSLDFLKVTYKNTPNVEQTGKIAFKLNEPLECLAQVEELLNQDDTFDSYDIKALVEGLFGSEFDFTAKVKSENDGKKISSEVHMKSGFPIIINKNFSMAANTNTSVWFDMNLDDDFSIDYIMSTPNGSKYILMNTEELLGAAGEETFDYVKNILDESQLEELNDKMVDIIIQNASITGNSRNVKISFTDIGFKKYIADTFTLAFEMMGENPFAELAGEETDAVLEVLAKVPFFAEEAAVFEYSLDSNGRISGEKIQINVNLNLFNLITALDESTDGLTEENSNISFSVVYDSAVKYNNITITKPELTEENSVNLADYATEPEYEIIEDDYEYYDMWPVFDVDALFLNSGDAYYIPLRNVLEAYNYEVAYENGVITAVTDSKFADYKTLKFTINSPLVVTDLGDVSLNNAPVMFGDKTYIRMLDAEILLKSRAENYYNNFGYGQSVTFFRLTDFYY